MEKQVAILIDGDNISSKYAEYIKEEALQYGNVKVYRLYGSISSPSVKSWYRVMPTQGIAPMLQINYARGKSIADQALTIDAMDLLYLYDIDTFCIVTSDCDFTKLVYRLKEAGKKVIGMGEKKTNESLAKACDEFKILDLIYKENVEVAEDEPEEIAPIALEDYSEEEEEIEEDDIEINIASEEQIISYISELIDESDDNRINLAEIGRLLRQKFLGFDARNYGHKNMTNMLKSHDEIFTVEMEMASDGRHKVFYVS